MTLSTPRATLVALAALAVSAAPHAQVVFDDFNDGNVSDIGTFSGGAEGIGIGVGTTDGQSGAANAALSIGINPGTVAPGTNGGYAGFVIPGGAGVTDVSGQTALTFYIRPTTVQAANLPITLQINFHEDVNENGSFDGMVEDEYQTLYSLTVGEGYTRVQIPLSDFTDDNSFTTGPNDGFDYSKLSEIVIAIDGLTGSEFAFAMDDFVFEQVATAIGDAPELFETALVTYPNPTTGAATVALRLAAPSGVAVGVYDLLGRRVAEASAGVQAAGPVEVAVPTAGLSAGTYIVRVTTAEGAATTRLTVVR